MLLLKILFQTIIIFSLVFTQTDITIYNQGRALINETRDVNLEQRGKQTLSIPNIPTTVDPSSINLFSDNIQFISKEFINKPITNQSLLNASIGKKIELVKYDEDGRISFSTMGKLISNINQPVFEIDGKVVVNPPYSYRFDNIPEGISNYSYLNCLIQSKTKKANLFARNLSPLCQLNSGMTIKIKSTRLLISKNIKMNGIMEILQK